MSETFLDGKTLAEKQMYYYNGHRCIYCDGETDLVDSIEVYQESHGLIYICRSCKAWVGVHGGNSDQSMGTVAKKPLRDLRHECHKWLDPLWMKKVSQGHSVRHARGKAYNWLAELLNIHRDESHIGFFNEQQCKAVIQECKKFYLTPEKTAEKYKLQQGRSKTVIECANTLGIKATEFRLNNIHKFEITHPETKKLFVYDVVTNNGGWALEGKKIKWQPIEDLIVFIENTFKTSPPKHKRVAGKRVNQKDKEQHKG